MFVMPSTHKLMIISNVLSALSCILIFVGFFGVGLTDQLLWTLSWALVVCSLFSCIIFRFIAICLNTAEKEVQELIYKSMEFNKE